MGISGLLSAVSLCLVGIPALGLLILCFKGGRNSALGWGLVLFGCVCWIVLYAILC